MITPARPVRRALVLLNKNEQEVKGIYFDIHIAAYRYHQTKLTV